MVESFLVPDYLNCEGLSGTMIPTVQYLTKRALPQGVDNLVPVRKMVVINDKIVASVVVIPVIVGRVVQHRGLLLASGTNTVYSREIEDFFAFIFGEELILRAFEDR